MSYFDDGDSGASIGQLIIEAMRHATDAGEDIRDLTDQAEENQEKKASLRHLQGQMDDYTMAEEEAPQTRFVRSTTSTYAYSGFSGFGDSFVFRW
jgi:hypothetical protein